jgi:hypothetical protein
VPEQPQLRSVGHHFSEVAASAAASSSALVTPFQKPSDVFNKTSEQTALREAVAALEAALADRGLV